MEKFFNAVNNHFDYKFYIITTLALIVLLLMLPGVTYLPETFGYENGLLENLQMLALLFSFLFALRAKDNKKFFYFICLVVLLLALREINYGRTIFFPIPGEVNAFYSWKEIPFGWLVNPLIGIYVAGSVLYFIVSKAYLQMWQLAKEVKVPVWNTLFLISGIVLGIYAEKFTENFVFEEFAELLFYVSLMGFVWIYSKNKPSTQKEN